MQRVMIINGAYQNQLSDIYDVSDIFDTSYEVNGLLQQIYQGAKDTWDKLGDTAENIAKKVKSINLQELGEDVKNIVNDVLGDLKNVATSPIEQAFYGLTALNVKGLASNTYKAIRNPNGSINADRYEELKRGYEKVLGNKGFSTWMNIVQRNKDKKFIGELATVTAATITGIIAVATPILLVILPMLDRMLGGSGSNSGSGTSDTSSPPPPPPPKEEPTEINPLLLFGGGFLALKLLKIF
jgi:hypothetical protein